MKAAQLKNPASLLALTLALLTALASPAQAQGTLTVTRTVSHDYDEYGQVIRETVEPDDAALRLESELTRDPASGVVMRRTLRWQDPASGAQMQRDEYNAGWDVQRRFETSRSNALGQSESRDHDPASGQVRRHTDAHQRATHWAYDGWGRKTRESRPDGSATSWAYRQCVAGQCPAHAASVVVTQHWQDGPQGAQQSAVPAEAMADRLGRVVSTRSWGFNGAAIVQERGHDAQGRLEKIGRPRWESGGAAIWTWYERDALGRVIRQRTPNQDGSGEDISRYTYDGQQLSQSNVLGQSRLQVSNGLGKLRRVTDAQGYSTRYDHDGWGELVRVSDPKGNRIDIGRDRLGRKTALADPNLGAWSYAVDPLGQTWRQQDAKGQVTRYEHDALGRLTRRLEPDLDSRWEYDSAAHGIGQLAEAYTLNGSGQRDYRRIHSYDPLGRPSSVLTRLDQDYLESQTYDGFGRLATLAHQRNAVGGSGGPQNRFSHGYNAQGHLQRIERDEGAGSGSSAVLVWQALEHDAEGRLTRQQLGNGVHTQWSYNAYTGRLGGIASGPAAGGTSHQNDVYTYDALGNLGYRAQLNGAGSLLQENFSYDTLNRLDSSQVLGRELRRYGYDELGNLKTKDGVGQYSYPASGVGSVRPAAVSGITGTVAGVVNPAFNYDANGNLSLGLNRQWSWSSFDMPQGIDKLSGAQAVERTGFVYGPEHQRAKQTVSPVSAGVVGAAHTVIWYAGAVEKEVATAANTTTIRTQLPQGLGWVQEVIAGTQAAATASATRQPRYPLEDHLGSPIAITDEAGAVLQRLSYDAWGRRRNLDGSDDAGAGWGSLKNGQDHSGYTGHEALDQLGLVHMNARLYDPLIGRHTSADPTVPEPANAQSLNRYSYVLNNALAFVDPTGLAGSTPPQKNLDAPRCSIGPKCDAMIVIPQESLGTFNGVRPSAGAAANLGNGNSADEGGLLNAVTSFLVSNMFGGISDNGVADLLSQRVNTDSEFLFNTGGPYATGPAVFCAPNCTVADIGLATATATLMLKWPVATEVGSARGGLVEARAASGEAPRISASSLRGTNEAGQLTSRGKFRRGTLTDAWENAAPGLNGGRLCPTCRTEVKVPPNSGVARDWDGSHNPSWTNRLFSPLSTRKQVLNNYNRGVSLECIHCNRSGQANDSRFGF